MNEYPDWVELLRYLGLDPITVWVEYRPVLFVSIAITVLLILAALYWAALRMRGLVANYKFAFADRLAFYRYIYEIEEKHQPAVEAALEGEPLVYAMPAIAYDEVPNFHRNVGYLVLTKTKLIFTANGKRTCFQLDAFDDANVRDGNKHMELKLIFNRRKPIFHLLGISRDHAQELFMKMHAFRLALRETGKES